MADYTAVGLGSQTPDMMSKLSGLLSLKSQQQALAGQAAEVASAQQTQRQRSALAGYDWNKHIGEDGTFDLNSLNDPELRQAAGDQYLDVVTHAVQAKQAQLEAKSKLVGLRNDQREAFAQLMGGLRSDKDVSEDNEKGRQKVNEAMIQYGQMYGDDVLPVLSAYAGPLQKAPKGRMSDALKAIQLQAHSASAGLAAQQPQYANTGPELTQINPNAAAGASSIPLGVGPGVQILTDQKGAQFAFNPQTNQVTPVGTGRGGGVSPSASPKQPTFQQPTYLGQERDIQAQQQEVQGVRTAADQAPVNRNIYRQVLKLADATSTGPLVSFLQNNAIGGQVFGDNYQELGKYLEKNAIANMQAMGGPPSDSRLDAAVRANGSTSFNAKALKAVTEFNYATNTGVEKYRQGIDKAIGTDNPNYGELPKFKAAWAKNFDVDVFKLDNAFADSDQSAARKILNDLTPKQAAALLEKRKNLESLSATGHLPQ